jgi:hypothetical protein
MWPDWIHKRKTFGPIRHKIGVRSEKLLPNPVQKIGTVCETCNNGWMHRLEDENIPIIGAMFNDIAIPLDVHQQTTVAAWAVKTAMVIDSVQGRDPANRFYRKSECEAMRSNHTIPDRTRIWIGRSVLSSLSAIGTHIGMFTPEIPARTPGMVVNIVVGHLVIQAITLHVHPELADRNIPDPNPKPGDWDNLLLQIWPVDPRLVMWPPKETFTNGGPKPIAALFNLWRGGEEIPLEVIKRVKTEKWSGRLDSN